jgi:AcrR family transcriptional regulator
MNGLRERKKAEMRQAISDVATRLFEARGFEAVTVAEIAAAADVSAKTVFNYFPAKEDLFFDAEDAVRDALVAAVPDVRALLLDGPVLGALDCRWEDFHGELYERMRIWTATEYASPALRARRLVITNSWVAPLAVAIGLPGWAAMLVGLINLRNETFARALLANQPARKIHTQLRTTIGPGLDMLWRPLPFR